ncbi:MAG: aromatic ring-hydroxylating dioxygenase subunit alpha [Betaproteobacteria bacterium]|nr:aromatic ring-hydroxylating dioxygenase subunit alpha [Betaproteobacteria bacterium]
MPANFTAVARADLLARLRATRAPLAEARTLPRAVYTSKAILDLEYHELFGKAWLAVMRDDDLPGAGSFLTHEIGGERILIIRGEDLRLRAFHNICRHRGSHLIDAARGQLQGEIRCPYHAWTYGYDGRLTHASRTALDFATAELGLTPIALDTFGGFVFINLGPAAGSLAESLADLPDLSGYRLSDLQRVHRVDYEINANWKIAVENYSECYHCPAVHPQLSRISDLVSGHFEEGISFNGGPMRLRPGFSTMSMSGWSKLGPMRGLPADKGELVHYYVVYPNLMLGLHPDYLLVHRAWPHAADRSHIVCEWFVPPEHRADPAFNADDILEFWDLTNRQDWALCERVQRGATSMGYREGPYHPAERCVHAFDKWYAEQLSDWLWSA